MALRILIADDHPIVPAGLRGLLHGRPGWEVCGEAASAAELLSATEALRPDIVLTDYHMPAPNAKDGIRLLRALRRCLPQGQVIVLTMITNPAVLRAILRTGVHGLVLKDAPPAEMALAIAQVQRGLFYVGRSALRILAAALGYGEPGEPGLPGLQGLSPREIEVLRLYLNGSSLTDIARASHRSIKTVSSQKLSAMRKLGACNDQELFAYAAHSGLVLPGTAATVALARSGPI
ncbi:DNA-binding response regulator [Cupriavidus sp. USMAA2-4]|uniref:DNA-binding response regulator n=1 Tax=Cupriavidus malaysiensis TaxID=367825 RepID=A0A1D9IDU8_9BURK|nr:MULTISPECIES: response regulator transcription factor [Cupriavidus]AOY94794.1 DNA-binding response regulator [Cupriavidus sp. USMAA2-4]AOZ02344.1 DNA-binding response regulator [Cupriavidus sp. USMAHM13]AOZ10282.1 DNA-binding response regulator [Cupriavidus malaysiensis]